VGVRDFSVGGGFCVPVYFGFQFVCINLVREFGVGLEVVFGNPHVWVLENVVHGIG
jgi:hypothetical protein